MFPPLIIRISLNKPSDLLQCRDDFESDFKLKEQFRAFPPEQCNLLL